jgi:methyl-accepting chemotaxis protein
MPVRQRRAAHHRAAPQTHSPFLLINPLHTTRTTTRHMTRRRRSSGPQHQENRMTLSFRTKLFLPLVLSWLCLLAIVAANSVHERALRMDERKTQIVNAGDMGISILKEYAAMVAAGKLTDAQAREQALARIKALRYGDTGYLLVIDSKQMLMHPLKADLVGRSVADIRDVEGRQMCLDALQAVKASGKGFTYLMWNKPGATAPERKITYDVNFQPWDWTIMTGLYIGDVDAAFHRSLLQSALVLALAGLILSACVVAIVRNIERSLPRWPTASRRATWPRRSKHVRAIPTA